MAFTKTLMAKPVADQITLSLELFYMCYRKHYITPLMSQALRVALICLFLGLFQRRTENFFKKSKMCMSMDSLRSHWRKNQTNVGLIDYVGAVMTPTLASEIPKSEVFLRIEIVEFFSLET